ncbi:hypothetical protein F01_421135 [Burkholderia cenocepacia]|nr:hypothetical protein F01_421135 [Burkholderia cenocepacia]
MSYRMGYRRAAGVTPRSVGVCVAVRYAPVPVRQTVKIRRW